MKLSLGKSDGYELEERIRAKIRTLVIQGNQTEREMIIKRAVDVFAQWLSEQEGPPVNDDLINKARQCYELARLAGLHVDDAGNEPDRATFRAVADCATLVPELCGRLERYELALLRLNQLRKNVTATQSATWSNAMYPMVAILNDAGFEDSPNRQVSNAQREAHMSAYGGAGKFPESEDDQ